MDVIGAHDVRHNKHKMKKADRNGPAFFILCLL